MGISVHSRSRLWAPSQTLVGQSHTNTHTPGLTDTHHCHTPHLTRAKGLISRESVKEAGCKNETCQTIAKINALSVLGRLRISVSWG